MMNDPKSPDGYYYLHTNGSLIFKKFEPESDSPFVVKVWPLSVKNRSRAWMIAVESLALGANPERVKELAELWGLTNEDAREFEKCFKGELVLTEENGGWKVSDKMTEQTGTGKTALEAFSDYAKHGLLKNTSRKVENVFH